MTSPFFAPAFNIMLVIRCTREGQAELLTWLRGWTSDRVSRHAGFQSARVYTCENSTTIIYHACWQTQDAYVDYRRSEDGQEAFQRLTAHPVEVHHLTPVHTVEIH